MPWGTDVESRIEYKLYNKDQLKPGAKFMKEHVACLIALCKSWPHKGYTQDLLARNYFQVKDATKLYAVGSFVSYAKMSSKARTSMMHVQVDGGTGWTVQAFAVMAKQEAMTTYHTRRAVREVEEVSADGKKRTRYDLALYLFNQTLSEHHSVGWYQGYLRRPKGLGMCSFGWTPLDGRPPLPEPGDQYAAIGSRALTQEGVHAIRDFWPVPSKEGESSLSSSLDQQ